MIEQCPTCGGRGMVQLHKEGDVVGIMTVCAECGGTGLIEEEED